MSILEKCLSDIEYEIKKIINKRIKVNKKIEYKEKYYDDSESIWEPEEQLFNAKEAIEDYEIEADFTVDCMR